MPGDHDHERRPVERDDAPLSGAIGNIIDRVRLGYVVDFILWYWRDHHWPAFNIADSAIVCGAAVLILFGWRESRRG